MRDVLLTGFPGFLAARLVPRLLDRADAIHCVVEPSQVGAAKRIVSRLDDDTPGTAARIILHRGDITEPELGLSQDLSRDSIGTVWHLAAVYDLAVPASVADLVNIRGTDNVLALASTCPNLKHLHYVSTCYVSGTYRGIFRESDLQVGQNFNNHYERSKFAAEVAVHAARERGLPVSIYRPSIVTGHSETGETSKLDGPFFILQWLLRSRRYAFLPRFPRSKNVEVNIVPWDYVIDALDCLSRREHSGDVFHISDPVPPTIEAVIGYLEDATGRSIRRIPIPESVAIGVLRFTPGLERFVGMPPEALHYLGHGSQYRCEYTASLLMDSGVQCPPLTSYVRRLVDWYEQTLSPQDS